MDILKSKRDQFRVDIRRQRTEQIFQTKRLIKSDDSTHNQIISKSRLEKIIDDPAVELSKFYQELQCLLDVAFVFPLEFLDELLQAKDQKLMCCLFTAVLGFLYQRGCQNNTYFVLYLSSSCLINSLLRLFQRRISPETALQSVQLLCASTIALQTSDKVALPMVHQNIRKIIPLLGPWLYSSNSHYPLLSLSALLQIAQKAQLIDQICQFDRIVVFGMHKEASLRTLAISVIGHICCFGNDQNIQHLFDKKLQLVLEVEIYEHIPALRQKIFWILGNIALYKKFIPYLKGSHMLLEKAIKCMLEDYYGISRECCFLLENYIQHVDIGEFDQQYNYVNCLLTFLITGNSDPETQQSCLRQIMAINQYPTLIHKLKNHPTLVLFLNHIVNGQELIDQILNSLS